jgi:effector-binding domain-containing protein
MEGNMSQICEIVDVPETPTLSIRSNIAVEGLPGLIGQSYGAIMQYMGELGEPVAGEPFVIYYNLDMKNLDVELGFPVSRSLPARGEIKPSTLPAGPSARTLYTGPYTDMGPAYEELTKFVTDSGHEPSGIAIEYYLTGPETPMEKHQTRIVFPLKK